MTMQSSSHSLLVSTFSISRLKPCLREPSGCNCLQQPFPSGMNSGVTHVVVVVELAVIVVVVVDVEVGEVVGAGPSLVVPSGVVFTANPLSSVVASTEVGVAEVMVGNVVVLATVVVMQLEST